MRTYHVGEIVRVNVKWLEDNYIDGVENFCDFFNMEESLVNADCFVLEADVMGNNSRLEIQGVGPGVYHLIVLPNKYLISTKTKSPVRKQLQDAVQV
jgi:hypothetical protein